MVFTKAIPSFRGLKSDFLKIIYHSSFIRQDASGLMCMTALRQRVDSAARSNMALLIVMSTEELQFFSLCLSSSSRLDILMRNIPKQKWRLEGFLELRHRHLHDITLLYSVGHGKS